MSARKRYCASLGAGFSLIEVLIGVMVLSLALLGLAAMFPVVVREQRQAREAVLAELAKGYAYSYLKNSAILNPPIVKYPPPSPGVSPLPQGWDAVKLSMGYGSWKWDIRQWAVPYDLYCKTGAGKYDGTMRFGTFVVPAPGVPVTERLLPAGAAADLSKTCIWDIAVCRRDTGLALPSMPFPDPNNPLAYGVWQPQVAVFIRHIDRNIKYDSVKSTLYATLAKGLALPVAVDASGIPTSNGTGSYAVPIFANVRVVPQKAIDGKYWMLDLDPATPAAELRGAAQYGQYLVDNTGVVRKVTGVDKYRLTVTPFMEDGDTTTIVSSLGRLQVVFTPQVADAAVVYSLPIPDQNLR